MISSIAFHLTERACRVVQISGSAPLEQAIPHWWLHASTIRMSERINVRAGSDAAGPAQVDDGGRLAAAPD